MLTVNIQEVKKNKYNSRRFTALLIIALSVSEHSLAISMSLFPLCDAAANMIIRVLMNIPGIFYLNSEPHATHLCHPLTVSFTQDKTKIQLWELFYFTPFVPFQNS